MVEIATCLSIGACRERACRSKADAALQQLQRASCTTSPAMSEERLEQRHGPQVGLAYMTCTHARYRDGSGVLRVMGGSELKASQHYPSMFGRCVAENVLRHEDC